MRSRRRRRRKTGRWLGRGMKGVYKKVEGEKEKKKNTWLLVFHAQIAATVTSLRNHQEGDKVVVEEEGGKGQGGGGGGEEG